MKTTVLGPNGPQVSRVGLGTMGMAGSYGAAKDEESVATIRCALELGVNHIDTADFYGPGTAERLVGEALAASGRDGVVVASKTGMRRGEDGMPYADGSPEYLRTAIDGSLERLGVDHLDLYYLARVDPNVPIEDSVGALAELVAQGKVKHIGLCEAAPSTLRRACAVHPITALQTEYSLWERHVEHEILPTCEELGIGLVAYRSLGSGFLSGGFSSLDELSETDWRRRDPRFQPDNLARNRRIAQAVQEAAAARGVTASQLALAWVASRGEHVVPLAGCKSRDHLEDNAAAADLVLTPAEAAELADAVPADEVAGDRYPAEILRGIDRG